MTITTARTETAHILPEDLNALSGQIVDSALFVHKKLGPGLLESAYQHGMAYALSRKNIPFETEKTISIQIDDFPIDAGYRADLIVGGKVIVEIKSVDKLLPIHEAQLLTYMKLGGYELGLLLNFNERLIKNGIRRMRL
ncbi:MAG: GxxExxY protein [Rhodospirillales bacterium]|nr:GxxExxY protein [Rhodospirillales bacterium]MCB9996042.1 GxxExxY protein [Rhodospirillales bacterium]